MVDGLPLALDQAAAYIEETPSTLDEYLQLYQSGRAKLLAERGELADDHRDSVAITFSLAFKKVAEANQAAAELLRLCAFLEADAIPEEIFREGAGELGEVLGSVAGSPVKLAEAIKEAGRFSLLQRNPEARTVSLHRLVQAVLRDEMDDDVERMWGERAVRAVNIVFPTNEYSNWRVSERLIPQVQSLAGLIGEFSFDLPQAAMMMHRAGQYLNDRAQYEKTEALLKRALVIYERSLGAEDSSIADCLHTLAMVYNNQGKYADAEVLLKRALQIGEKALGTDDSNVADILSSLAGIYYNQGKYAEVEPLLKRTLASTEKTLGPDHLIVASSFSILGLLYNNQGKYGEAEPLLKQALTGYEKSLGVEHPHVAVRLEDLALLYNNQEKYAEAEPLLKRTLAIIEKSLGEEHPDVAAVLENYASLLRKMGKDAKAEELEARASTIRTKYSLSNPQS